MQTEKFKTVAGYINSVSGIQKKQLQQIRNIIKQAAPADAEEVISYNIPAIKAQTVLVYYAAYAHHIGFYPTGAPIKAFANALTGYKTSEGAVQFPLEHPLPEELIKQMVRYRIKDAEEKAAAKRSRPVK
ncbi:hypothetical protein A8C56_14960 [Niabella ginsenosidivorans]|uniref:YdhG-like domain-containing protein n=1 Tax=Niabella ginsenosidivorans TaxID=1176587 RepID=A0A1A9I5W5_9BACT|nr:DUF1801 domain-containing protein [Niabella ginsenosidivorans]ANH82100.1 hypothetical protein A8C56_14960 [Niabella ginsenosidivorans]